MKTNTLDFILAMWIMLMGVLFIGNLLVELQVVTRGVYVIMLGFCTVKAALSATKSISGMDK